MKSFDQISEEILAKLKDSEITKFTLENIQKILSVRNFMLFEYDLDWLYWELIDEKKDEKEIEFRDASYDYIKYDCRDSGLIIENDELEKIFRFELEILDYVANINSYYYALDNFLDSDLKSEHTIDKWTNWNDSIDDAVEDFTDEFGVFPNILKANEHTFSQINFLINNVPGEKHNVLIYDEEIKMQVPADSNKEDVIVDSYVTDYYTLSFDLNDKLKDKTFILEYDESHNPDDDDEDNGGGGDDDDVFRPVPVDDLELVKA